MMKKKIALVLAMLMVFSVVSFTGCSSAGTGSNTITKGYLTIGVDDTYPPMEYQDGSGNLIGFDVDMATQIASGMGLKVKWVPTSFDGIFSALQSRKFDCIVSSVSITTDREKTLALTKPYCANAQMIVVKPNDSSIKSENDLAGKTVAVQSGTTAKDSADKLNSKGIKFTVKAYDQIIQCFNDLKLGRVNAVIVDEVVGKYYIAQNAADYKDAGVNLTNEPIGIAFRKNNAGLRDKVQAQLDTMVSGGKMKDISTKWFGEDLTSNIDAKLFQVS